MTEWRKAGVMGQLNHQAQKCKGRLIRLYESKGVDFYLTCCREGTHMGGNFHEIGDAFDFRYNNAVTEAEIRTEAGSGFDLVFHASHIHCEYDPKEEYKWM